MSGADMSTARLEALAAAATPAPWESQVHECDDEEYLTDLGPIGAQWLNCGPDAMLDGPEADLDLVALAPALLAEVLRLRAGIAARVARLDSQADAEYHRGLAATGSVLTGIADDLRALLDGGDDA